MSLLTTACMQLLSPRAAAIFPLYIALQKSSDSDASGPAVRNALAPLAWRAVQLNTIDSEARRLALLLFDGGDHFRQPGADLWRDIALVEKT